MSKLLNIWILVLVVGLYASSDAYGQLLEDRNKLKTERLKTKGFSLYKKKAVKRSPSGQTQVDDKQVAPKYSQGVAGDVKSKKTKTRYSKKEGKRRYRSVYPKYSIENAGQFAGRAVAPRYSKPRKVGKVQIVSPKYSVDVAGKGSDRGVYPKYSRDVAGQGADRLVSPKYSIDVAGQGADRLVNPRYTRWLAGQGFGKVVSPRYSQDVAGQGFSNKIVNPRYSLDVAGQGFGNVFVKPRYSQYVAGQGMDRVVVPRSASGSMVFSIPRKLHEKNRKFNKNGESEWFGPEVKIIDHKRSEFASYTGKFKKQKREKKTHPSANYLYAKYNNSGLARDMMQKASVLWVRVHMNQTDPKGVKKKPAKLRYDKEEAEIWNNKEREYIKN